MISEAVVMEEKLFVLMNYRWPEISLKTFIICLWMESNLEEKSKIIKKLEDFAS